MKRSRPEWRWGNICPRPAEAAHGPPVTDSDPIAPAQMLIRDDHLAGRSAVWEVTSPKLKLPWASMGVAWSMATILRAMPLICQEFQTKCSGASSAFAISGIHGDAAPDLHIRKPVLVFRRGLVQNHGMVDTPPAVHPAPGLDHLYRLGGGGQLLLIQLLSS